MDNAVTRLHYMIDAVFTTVIEHMRAPLEALGGNDYCLTCFVLSASFAPVAHRCDETIGSVTCALSGNGSTGRSQKLFRHQRQNGRPAGCQWPNPAGRWRHDSPRGRTRDAQQTGAWYGSEDKNSFVISDERTINNFKTWMVFTVQRVNPRIGVRDPNDPTIIAWELMDGSQAPYSLSEHLSAAMSDYVKHPSLTCTTNVGVTWQVLSDATRLRRKVADDLWTEQVKHGR